MIMTENKCTMAVRPLTFATGTKLQYLDSVNTETN